MKENIYPTVSENNLLIRIHPEGVFYAIVDENEQVILQQMIHMPAGKLKDVDFLEHFFDQPELRVLSENVFISFENSNYLLIPNELFRSDDVKILYETEFGKTDNLTLDFNILPQWGAHLVYQTDVFLVDFLEKKYPDADIEHHIFKLLRKKVKRNTNSIYANLRKEAVDIIVVKNNDLLLTNTLEIKTEEDICYFILNIYEQLELGMDVFPLKIISENPIDNSLFELMKQYIQVVE